MDEFGDRFARELGGAAVERERPVGEAEFAEGDRRAAKAVGFDRIAAGLEISSVDLADQIRPALADDFGAVLEAEKVALDVEIAPQHLGPHRAVAEHDAVREIIKEVRHRTAVDQATAAAGFLARTPSMWQIATVRSARFKV